MATFIDDSGCCGWKKPGSHEHFAIAAVWFEKPQEAAACSRAIEGFRKSEKLPEDREFRFTDTDNVLRLKFLSAMASQPFYFVASVLRKWQNGDWLKGAYWREKVYLYERVVTPAVQTLRPYLEIADVCKGSALNERVIYDENDDPVYRRVLKEQFKKPKAASGRPIVKKVKPGSSTRDNLLQLADMVCGAVVRSSVGETQFLEVIKKRKLEIHLLP